MTPFRPFAAKTVNISVSSSSQRIEFTTCDTVRVMNNGTATVWVDFGDVAITASTTTSFPVGPGVTEVLSVPRSLDGARRYAAAIAAGSTGSIYFTPGEGV